MALPLGVVVRADVTELEIRLVGYSIDLFD